MKRFHDFLAEETKKIGRTEAVRALAEEAKRILEQLGLVVDPYKLYYNRASGQTTLQWKVASSVFTVALDFRVGVRTRAGREKVPELPIPENLVVAKFKQEGFLASPWCNQENKWFLDIILAQSGELTAWLELGIPSCKIQE